MVAWQINYWYWYWWTWKSRGFREGQCWREETGRSLEKFLKTLCKWKTNFFELWRKVFGKMIWSKQTGSDKNWRKKTCVATSTTTTMLTISKVLVKNSIIKCKKFLSVNFIYPWFDSKQKQRTRGLSSGYQSNFFKSIHKFSNKSWSDFTFLISIKPQLQNSNQISAFRLNLNFKILTKPQPRMSSKTLTKL